jgi:hypothetical protein
MKNIVLINGSPKVNETSTSKFLAEALGARIDPATANQSFINIRQSISRHRTEQDFATISKADTIIIAFPLYIFCLPGILIRFLEDYYNFYLENGRVENTKVYAIVNCGFPEPGINLEAVRVIRSFCRHIKADFRFGILIGGGGMLLEARDAPFMRKTIKELEQAFASIVEDIAGDALQAMDNINIAMNFPRRLYFFMGHRGWVSLARKNGLKKKDLYRRPYR